MPAIGEKVRIKPAPQHCRPKAPNSGVLADPHTGRFLPVDGEDAIWTAHHAERLKHGEITVEEIPAAAPAKAPVKE